MFDRIQNLVMILSKQLNWLPPLLSRLSVGWLFLLTGWGKLHGIEQLIGYFTELRIPYPGFMAHVVALTEFICGGFLLIGLLSRLVTIPLIINMTVAILT